MENEIELKIMLHAEKIPDIQAWIATLSCLAHGRDQLANCYYDTYDLFFARQKMGLRVRSRNHHHELTLKTAGNIVGGLHIRPEYNLALPNARPDFAALAQQYQLPFSPTGELLPTFSTDFERQHWLMAYQGSQIEIALDQGWIQNGTAKDAICELEFELKQGDIADLLALLAAMPKQDGMWLSSLSKAQRGYLVGNPADIAKTIEKLTACSEAPGTLADHYQREQQIVDFIRLTGDARLIACYQRLNPSVSVESIHYFYSADYLTQSLAALRAIALP